MFKQILEEDISEDGSSKGSGTPGDVHAMSLEEASRTMMQTHLSNSAKRTMSQMFMNNDEYSKDFMVGSAPDGSIQTIFGGIDLSSATQDATPVPIHLFNMSDDGKADGKKRKRKSSSSRSKKKKSSSIKKNGDKKNVTVSRRQARNRISAKRSRLRKESLTSALKDANRKLEEENRIMRDYLQKLTGQTVFLRQEGMSLNGPVLTPGGTFYLFLSVSLISHFNTSSTRTYVLPTTQQVFHPQTSQMQSQVPVQI